MDDLFQQIEDRIRLLSKKYTDLKKTNVELVQVKKRMFHENEHLLAKHKDVANLIENTVSKLKSIEGLS